MNKSEARRIMIDAFAKTAAEPVSTVPGVAQVKHTPRKAPRTIEGPMPKAGPAKGMVPPMQLKTTAPTSLNVTDQRSARKAFHLQVSLRIDVQEAGEENEEQVLGGARSDHREDVTLRHDEEVRNSTMDRRSLRGSP
jgi:hypothetical protein